MFICNTSPYVSIFFEFIARFRPLDFYTNLGKKELLHGKLWQKRSATFEDGPVTGALQQFLCLALRSPHLRDLLELPEDVLSEWLQCIEAQNSLGDPFADAWKCAQKQQLLEAAKLQQKGQEKQGSVSLWQRLRRNCILFEQKGSEMKFLIS